MKRKCLPFDGKDKSILRKENKCQIEKEVKSVKQVLRKESKYCERRLLGETGVELNKKGKHQGKHAERVLELHKRFDKSIVLKLSRPRSGRVDL